MSHQLAFAAALPASVGLALQAPTSRALAAVAIYGASLTTLFGVSALYHRITWTSERTRFLMKRLDHSAIVFMIAGTATPFCLALSERRVLTLAIVWGAALLGLLRALFWVRAPKLLAALSYVAIGWVLTPFLPELASTVGDLPLTLVLVGGVVYSLGALVYGKKWPNPSPRVFGFHEIFHLMVIVASALHYIAVAQVAMRL